MEIIEKYLKEIEPRKYQEDIYKTCEKDNCLVVLPTGLGKTLIALMLTINRMSKFPEDKVLFLAPTRPLANQHFNYFKKHLPELFASMELFTGKTKAKKREKLWQKADIIFSTPQCISNDLKKNRYNLKNTSLLVEDECHRCVANYSYTYVAKRYKKESNNTRLLGITASPGYKKSKIKKICKNLGIKKIEVRTRDSDDVKEYIEERKFETIKVDFPEELKKIKDPLKEILDRRIKELKNRKLLFRTGSKKALLEVQNRVFKSINSGNKNYNLLAGASCCAQAIKLQHALELLETQTLSAVKLYFKKIFDQAKKGKSKAVQRLVKDKRFNKAYTQLIEVLGKNKEHPKLEELKKIVREEIKDPELKIMVFAQYRNSVRKICKELNSIDNIKAKVFVGQAKKRKSGLSQDEQKALIEEFSEGRINSLISTSIGEEGLDIPELDMVIFYDNVPSAIRKIQRAGRTARLRPGKLVFLVTKGTRDEGYYWAAFHKNKKMYKALDKIKKEMKSGEKQKTLS